jgi:predicted nucleic acid-binding protein
LVLDASAGLHAVMGLEYAGSILDRIEESTIVMAPAIYSAEVANGLYRYFKAGELTESRALELYDIAVDLVDHLVGEQEFAREALATSSRYSHPVYDSLYAVLARRNSCPILTLDRRLVALLQQVQVEPIHPR